MQYQFDSKIAEKHGVESAIMLNNLAFWIRKNIANGKHFYNGNYWTYNSVKAFSDLFPFWSVSAIRRILESLEKQGLLIKGNFNESSYDRTAWYSFSDECLSMFEIDFKISKSICGNQQMDLSESTNQFDDFDKCIIGTDNKTQIHKTQIEETALNFLESNSHSEWENFQMRFRKQFTDDDWIKFQEIFNCKAIEESLEYTTKKIVARLTRFAVNYLENNSKAEKKNNPAQTPEPTRKLFRG